MPNPYLPQYYNQRDRVFRHPWMRGPYERYNSFINVARNAVPAAVASARVLAGVDKKWKERQQRSGSGTAYTFDRVARSLRGYRRIAQLTAPKKRSYGMYRNVATRPRYSYNRKHYLNKKGRIFKKSYRNHKKHNWNSKKWYGSLFATHAYRRGKGIFRLQ